MLLEKIRNIANKKSIRIAAVVALMGASKLSLAESKTETRDVPKKAKTTRTVEEGADSDTPIYNPSMAEIGEMAEGSNFELVKMNFDVNYETDKADLAEQYKEEIVNKFVDFLDRINKDNFDVANEADWQVFSSCDERQTNAWGEKGNEALAEARGQSVIETLEEVLVNYDFESLSEKQCSALKGKGIGNKIASEHLDRVGERLIIDKINSETGENYTAKEVQSLKENDPDKYSELLSENRVSEFKAEIPVAKLEELGIISIESESKSVEIITSDKKELVKRFSDYKNVILLLDNSPSMRNDKEELSKKINDQQANLINTNLFVGHYSDELKSVNKVEDINNVEAEIMKDIGRGSSTELSVQAAIAAWEKIGLEIEPSEKTLILVNTDEGLQQFSAEDLKQLENLPDNVEIRFAFHLNKDQCLEVSLGAVQDQFDQVIAKKTSAYRSRLKTIEGNLAKIHLRQLQAPNKSLKKHFDKQIKGLEKQQETYISKIAETNEKLDSKKITLSKITDETGRVIELNIHS